MEHGVGLDALVVVAAGALMWGLVGTRLERWNFTAPIAFMLFGLLAANEPLQIHLVPILEGSSWTTLLYAALSLTLVRMVPVALALIGTGLDRVTVLMLGWFGPRGLASVVFALIAFDSLDSSDAHRALSAVSVVVLLSIVTHGVSARPVATWYAWRIERLSREGPEHRATAPMATRPFVRPRSDSGNVEG